MSRLPGWNSKVYLIDISSYDKAFSGSDLNVIDSAEIYANDSFCFENLKPNRLYRVNVVPENQIRGAFIQNSKTNNYAFFVPEM